MNRRLRIEVLYTLTASDVLLKFPNGKLLIRDNLPDHIAKGNDTD